MRKKKQKRKVIVLGTALAVCLLTAVGVWSWNQPSDREKMQETAEQTEQTEQKAEEAAEVIREDGTVRFDVQKEVDNFLSQVAESSGTEVGEEK